MPVVKIDNRVIGKGRVEYSDKKLMNFFKDLVGNK